VQEGGEAAVTNTCEEIVELVNEYVEGTMPRFERLRFELPAVRHAPGADASDSSSSVRSRRSRSPRRPGRSPLGPSAEERDEGPAGPPPRAC